MKKGVLEIMKFYTQYNLGTVYQNYNDMQSKIQHKKEQYLFMQFLKIYAEQFECQVQEKQKKNQKKQKNNSQLDCIEKFIFITDFLVMIQKNSILQSEYQVLNVAYNKMKSEIKNLLKNCQYNLKENFVDYLQIIDSFVFSLNLFIKYNIKIFNSLYCQKEIQQIINLLINNTYKEFNKNQVVDLLVNYLNLRSNKSNIENVLNFLTQNTIQSIMNLNKIKLKNMQQQKEIKQFEIWTNKLKDQSSSSLFQKLINNNIAIILEVYIKYFDNLEILQFATADNFHQLYEFFRQLCETNKKIEIVNFIKSNNFYKLVKVITKYVLAIKMLNIEYNKLIIQIISKHQIAFQNPKVQFCLVKLVKSQFYNSDHFKQFLKDSFLTIIEDAQNICNYLQKPQIDFFFTGNYNKNNDQTDLIIEKENKILSLLVSMEDITKQKLCYKYLKTLIFSLEILGKEKQVSYYLYLFCKNILQNGYFFKNFSKQIQEQIQIIFQIFNQHIKKLDENQIKNVQFKYQQFKKFNNLSKEFLDFNTRRCKKKKIINQYQENQQLENTFSFQNFQPDQKRVFQQPQSNYNDIYISQNVNDKFNLTFQRAKSVQLSVDDLQKVSDQNLSIHMKQTFDQNQEYLQQQDQTSLDLPKLNLEQLQKKFIKGLRRFFFQFIQTRVDFSAEFSYYYFFINNTSSLLLDLFSNFKLSKKLFFFIQELEQGIIQFQRFLFFCQQKFRELLQLQVY